MCIAQTKGNGQIFEINACTIITRCVLRIIIYNTINLSDCIYNFLCNQISVVPVNCFLLVLLTSSHMSVLVKVKHNFSANSCLNICCRTFSCVTNGNTYKHKSCYKRQHQK